jgi:hypothetical protein
MVIQVLYTLSQRREKIRKANNHMLLVELDRNLSKRCRTYTTLKGYEVVSKIADLRNTREISFWKHRGAIWKSTILQIDSE